MTFWYLATPYTDYPRGRMNAFIDAAEASARLLLEGRHVYSPIVHSHPIAVHGEIDQTDHEFWMWVDRPMMEAACGLIVVRMPGWDKSKGIAEEIRFFEAAGKPVEYME